MLADPTTVEMALFALTPIPDKTVDIGLLKAMDSVDDKVTIINALGSRGNKNSIGKILPFMKNSDKVLAVAAISAAGQIGGDEAVKALSAIREKGLHIIQTTNALMQCAKHFTEQDNSKKAFEIYQNIYKSESAYHIRYAALRSMIYTSQENASNIVLAILRDDEKEMYAGAIQLINIIPVSEDISAIAKMAPDLSANNKIKVTAVGTIRSPGCGSQPHIVIQPLWRISWLKAVLFNTHPRRKPYTYRMHFTNTSSQGRFIPPKWPGSKFGNNGKASSGLFQN